MKTKTQITLEILLDEALSDMVSAQEKMSSQYSMTWMYKGRDTLFPLVEAAAIKNAMQEAYFITDREYLIFNICENDNSVFVELIESYSLEGVRYQTPMVLVLYFEDNKIKTGRHYCDPNLSHISLSKDILSLAYKNQIPQYVVSKEGIKKLN